jgi:hypothetical protein
MLSRVTMKKNRAIVSACRMRTVSVNSRSRYLGSSRISFRASWTFSTNCLRIHCELDPLASPEVQVKKNRPLKKEGRRSPSSTSRAGLSARCFDHVVPFSRPDSLVRRLPDAIPPSYFSPIGFLPMKVFRPYSHDSHFGGWPPFVGSEGSRFRLLLFARNWRMILFATECAEAETPTLRNPRRVGHPETPNPSNQTQQSSPPLLAMTSFRGTMQRNAFVMSNRVEWRATRDCWCEGFLARHAG